MFWFPIQGLLGQRSSSRLLWSDKEIFVLRIGLKVEFNNGPKNRDNKVLIKKFSVRLKVSM